MKLSLLLTINAIVAFIFGLAFVIMPGQTIAMYGPMSTPALNYAAQLFGSALLTISILTWMARNGSMGETGYRFIIYGLWIFQESNCF